MKRIYKFGNLTVLMSLIHMCRYGGIIPPRAQDLHRAKIVEVFEECMQEAQITPNMLDAIGVTTRPGL